MDQRAAEYLRKSAERLRGGTPNISVTFTETGPHGAQTKILYSMPKPVGRYITDPASPGIEDPSIPALEATLAAWRQVGIEPRCAGTTISNDLTDRVHRTWIITEQPTEGGT